MIPPAILLLRVNRLRLWLPLFLLWPLLLLLAPFAALAALFTRHPFRALAESYGILCALRGLQVHVKQPDQTLKIVFI